MEAVTFKLEDFEGPLDLLLFLVSKNKMNIYDIEIMSLIDHYTAAVNSATDRDMESVSEFVEMAARLVQMKSFLLLPKSEEAERMKAELTGMLIEYSLCKVVAEKMRAMSDGIYTAVRLPAEVELDNAYTLTHDVYTLEEAYNSLQGRSLRKRQPRQEQFQPIVTAPFVSVSSRVIKVLKGLAMGRINKLKQLFTKQDSRSQTVATFLAVLELVRGGRVKISDDGSLVIDKQSKRRLKGE